MVEVFHDRLDIIKLFDVFLVRRYLEDESYKLFISKMFNNMRNFRLFIDIDNVCNKNLLFMFLNKNVHLQLFSVLFNLEEEMKKMNKYFGVNFNCNKIHKSDVELNLDCWDMRITLFTKDYKISECITSKEYNIKHIHNCFTVCRQFFINCKFILTINDDWNDVLNLYTRNCDMTEKYVIIFYDIKLTNERFKIVKSKFKKIGIDMIQLQDIILNHHSLKDNMEEFDEYSDWLNYELRIKLLFKDF